MDWSDFGRRLPVELGRYRTLGLSYDQAALQPYAEGREVAPDRVRVTLTTPVGLGEIRYTLDGRAPTATSPLYAGPV
ncbi:chitobiase/beta-hexosaminidase C-terminal domain-containing protein, partial [Staphylococcus aureus]